MQSISKSDALREKAPKMKSMADAGMNSLIDFDATGPKNIHANSPNVKRICMACLVNAAYILEIYRQRALGPKPPAASAWSEPFNYKLKRLLLSPTDGSIFGAVFVWSYVSALRHFQFHRPSVFPAIVIVFRGTIFSPANIISDLRDDFHLILQQIHKVSRLDEALRVTKQMVRDYGAQNVCLAGHSLGAAIALKVGRIIAEEGLNVDTHLFNPPFFSLISVNDEQLGVFIHKIRECAAGRLTRGRKDDAHAQATFIALQKWFPNLYINVYDPVACNYLYYFRARQSFTAHSSIVNSVLYLLGRKPEAHHLLPSAHLFVNSTGSREFKVAHGLYQWWSEDTKLQAEQHSLKLQELADLVNKFEEVIVSGSFEHSM